MIDLAKSSQKFLLPPGGRLFDDREYRALDETEELRLPFGFVALEYVHESPTLEPGVVSAKRRVCFAREYEDVISITVVFRTDHDGAWRCLPEVAIPRRNYLDRTQSRNGYVAIRVATLDGSAPIADYGDEVGTLMCFLNVLQCSNIQVERSDPKTKGKVIKSALPFDSYHILTVGRPQDRTASIAEGGHRSPREHLRRGHIRRLESGVRVWINATVVNHGVGGRIEKDYRLN